jgi:hypothetical protein
MLIIQIHPAFKKDAKKRPARATASLALSLGPKVRRVTE